MKKLFEHFKATIYSEFNFLKNFGFTDFEELEIAHEYHIFTKSNNNITIDFQIEMICSTPIWITINGISLEKIFISNPIFENYSIERENLYKDNFDEFLRSDNSEYLIDNQEIFAKKGFLLNEKYLKEIKSLLIEKSEFLKDPSIYYNLWEKINEQNKLELAEYYKPFQNLFDHHNKILIGKEFLKSQFHNNILIVETDKVSLELNSYEEYSAFLASFSEMEINHDNVIYKFEPK